MTAILSVRPSACKVCLSRGSRPREKSPAKNKVEKAGMFFDTQKCPATHHVYHAFHHDLTIKTPRSAPRFSQNPLQKRQFDRTNKMSP
jgi:hypothetical protein